MSTLKKRFKKAVGKYANAVLQTLPIEQFRPKKVPKKKVEFDPKIYYGPIYTRHNYFNDQARKIDFVLVSNVLKMPAAIDMLTTYLYELLKQGMHYEIATSEKFPQYVFIKLHCPYDILHHQAHIHNILFDYEQPRSTPSLIHGFYKWRIFNNVTTMPRPKHPTMKRAFATLTRQKATDVLSWERSYIVHKILRKTRFGALAHQVGIENLIAEKVVIDAYPMHDGPWKWRQRGPLTDRQILNKYWANLPCLFKNQPIQLIYKYFGPQVAFYFAFLDFYSKMLIVPALIGILCLIFNVLADYFTDIERITEICTSKAMMCPICCGTEKCKFVPISQNCYAAQYNTLFDNVVGIIFGISISLWSSIFIDLWQRREYTLNFHWNLLNYNVDASPRGEFIHRSKHTRVSPLSGKLEYYVPVHVKSLKFLLTVICCLFLTILVFVCVIIIIYSRCFLRQLIMSTGTQWMKDYRPFVTLLFSVFESIIFVQVLTPIFLNAAIYLTDEENPPTSTEYYNACTFKFYYLQFVNNYSPILYVAFVKGIFFTHPGDMSNYDLWGLKVDLCTAVGCSFTLTFYLLYFAGYKTFVLKALQLVIVLLKKIFVVKPSERAILEQERLKHLHAWERDLLLSPCTDLFLMSDYMEFFIRHGFMIFFIAGFPLMPLLVLFAVFIQIRLDARKILHKFRRPVAKLYPGIGPWNGILRFMTFIGALSNALVITFTSDSIDVLLYKQTHKTMQGFVNSTFSEFATQDYPDEFKRIADLGEQNQICVYKARRYSYNHPEKYRLSEDHWRIVFFKLCFVLIFQQVLWLLNAAFATIIGRESDDVLSDLNDELVQVREIRYQQSKKHFNTDIEEICDFQIT